jgi:hypothetical protein
LPTSCRGEIASGSTERYAWLWHSQPGLTPSELIRLSKDTGKLPERSASDPTNNGVVGDIFEDDDDYLWWVERLQEFVNFLRYCGGFQIY